MVRSLTDKDLLALGVPEEAWPRADPEGAERERCAVFKPTGYPRVLAGTGSAATNQNGVVKLTTFPPAFSMTSFMLRFVDARKEK
ncbi:hypothetical protein NDU88_001885 [Pleurodeles waltl]|uniref:Uncharacterized protein n=1 Tax=Pleurodeles waltl TaxID=8319 RepID=A0AAV7VXN4_PLEWA|nr:hypothetical protein NDU88_001885 [Pleurodeles waltl]